MANPILGPKGRLYADPTNTPDETSFQIDNTSAAYFNSPYYVTHKSQVEQIPPRQSDAPVDLRSYLPQSMIEEIVAAGRVSFHAVGDTGGSEGQSLADSSDLASRSGARR